MPLLALVVGMIAAAQMRVVRDALPILAQVFWVYLGFLLGAALLGWALTRLFGQPVAASRTLAFSLGTRNSFVVLLLAVLCRPDGRPR